MRLEEASRYSVFDSEIAAIRLAIHVARRLSLIGRAVIFSDSQQAILLIDPSSGSPSLTLAIETRRELKALHRRHGGTAIWLVWCPGHSGIRGSELADREAKDAARGRDYGDAVPNTFSGCLPLPLDLEPLRKGLKEHYEALAAWTWEDSAAGAKQNVPGTAGWNLRDPWTGWRVCLAATPYCSTV